MITRQEKNKKVFDELKKEKALKLSKKIFQVIISIFIVFLLLFAYIYFIGVKGLITNEYVIKNELIPKSFYGVKILHFSDILYGKTIFEKEINNLKKEINLINPDIVLFTGNIVSNDYQLEKEDIKILNSFFNEIPYKIGKYAIMGDVDNSNFHLLLENTNFIILDNEIIDVYNKTEESINIMGINKKNDKDIIQNNNNYTITLINNYDNYNKDKLKSNLIVAGHNLGGEIRLFDYPLIGKDLYKGNYYEENNSIIYISNGLGSIHHLRFMNHPSINVYRLVH